MIEQWTSLVFPRVYRDTNMEESSLKRGDFIGGDDDGDHSTLAGESQLALTPPAFPPAHCISLCSAY